MCAVICGNAIDMLPEVNFLFPWCQSPSSRAQKWGFQRQKAHKKPDFVLETPKNGGSECKKRTKMGLLCAFLFLKAAHCGPRCLRLALGTAQLWSDHLRPALRLASGPTACEPTACGADCLQSRLPAGPTVCRADCLRSQPPAGLEA